MKWVDLTQIKCEIKLADFGFATICKENEKLLDKCGTPLYMAPELLNNKYYTNKADIWGLGTSLYISLFGGYPFNAITLRDLIKVVNDGIIQIPEGFNISN